MDDDQGRGDARRPEVNMLARVALVTLLSAGGAASARAQTPAALDLLGYHTTVPASWTPRTPSSSSRLAEFTLPRDAKGDAEVVVYFFGKGMGGNVDANLARWRGQFSTPDGSPVFEKVTRDSTGKFPLTFAEFRGTYQRGVGMGSADSVRTGQTLIASIVETPNGVLFVQMFGSSGRVEEGKESLIRFVKEVR